MTKTSKIVALALLTSATASMAADVRGPHLTPDSVTSARIKDGEIVNADIAAGAAIADTKLGQITTDDKVAPGAVAAGSLPNDVIASSVAAAAVGEAQLDFDPATQAELVSELGGLATTYVNRTGDSMTGQLTLSGSSLTVGGAGQFGGNVRIPNASNLTTLDSGGTQRGLIGGGPDNRVTLGDTSGWSSIAVLPGSSANISTFSSSGNLDLANALRFLTGTHSVQWGTTNPSAIQGDAPGGDGDAVRILTNNVSRLEIEDGGDLRFHPDTVAASTLTTSGALALASTVDATAFQEGGFKLDPANTTISLDVAGDLRIPNSKGLRSQISTGGDATILNLNASNQVGLGTGSGIERVTVGSPAMVVSATASFTGTGDGVYSIQASSGIRIDGRSHRGLTLDMNGSADYRMGERNTADVFEFGGAASASNNLHHNFSTGNLGIGAAPSERLEVTGTGNVTIRIDATDSAGQAILDLNSEATSGRQWLVASKSGGNLTIDDNDAGVSLATFKGGGLANTLTLDNDGKVGVNLLNPGANFDVLAREGEQNVLAVSSSTGAAFLRVIHNGKVGVGVTPPAVALDVRYQEDVTTDPILNVQGSGLAGAYMQIQEAGTKTWAIGIEDGQDDLHFRENSADGTARLTLEGTGDITVSGPMTVESASATFQGASVTGLEVQTGGVRVSGASSNFAAGAEGIVASYDSATIGSIGTVRGAAAGSKPLQIVVNNDWVARFAEASEASFRHGVASSGTIRTEGNFRMPNAQSLQAQDSGGTFRSILSLLASDLVRVGTGDTSLDLELKAGVSSATLSATGGHFLLPNNAELRWRDSGGNPVRILELDTVDKVNLDGPTASSDVCIRTGSPTADSLCVDRSKSVTVNSGTMTISGGDASTFSLTTSTGAEIGTVKIQGSAGVDTTLETRGNFEVSLDSDENDANGQFRAYSGSETLIHARKGGGLAPRVATKSALEAAAPTLSNALVVCSDCSTAGVCISTGTATVDQYADVAQGKDGAGNWVAGCD